MDGLVVVVMELMTDLMVLRQAVPEVVQLEEELLELYPLVVEVVVRLRRHEGCRRLNIALGPGNIRALASRRPLGRGLRGGSGRGRGQERGRRAGQ